VPGGDVRLGWDSPLKELIHPRRINLQSRGGLRLLEGFTGWFILCGLESNGHPETDKFTNNVRHDATMGLTLRSKMANIPASEVAVVIDSDPTYRLPVRKRVAVA